MSDKTMHVLAYFALTFLVWFAISPYEKVRWDKAKCWCVILVVVLYGVFDELLQARVGRSADIMDLVADFFGVILGLGLLSIVDFWTSLLVTSAVFIFVLSDMTRLMALSQYSHYASAFHFTAYTAFTLIWTQWMERFSRIARGGADWLAVSLSTPFGLLLGVKVAAPYFGRVLNVFDVAIAVFGILAAVLVLWGVFKFSRRATVSE